VPNLVGRSPRGPERGKGRNLHHGGGLTRRGILLRDFGDINLGPGPWFWLGTPQEPLEVGAKRGGVQKPRLWGDPGGGFLNPRGGGEKKNALQKKERGGGPTTGRGGGVVVKTTEREGEKGPAGLNHTRGAENILQTPPPTGG